MMLTSSLPIELRDDFAHSLGSAGGSRDDVLMGTAAITPGLGAGAVHCLLGGCVCMDCSLQIGTSYRIYHLQQYQMVMHLDTAGYMCSDLL